MIRWVGIALVCLAGIGALLAPLSPTAGPSRPLPPWIATNRAAPPKTNAVVTWSPTNEAVQLEATTDFKEWHPLASNELLMTNSPIVAIRGRTVARWHTNKWDNRDLADRIDIYRKIGEVPGTFSNYSFWESNSGVNSYIVVGVRGAEWSASNVAQNTNTLSPVTLRITPR